MEPAEAGLDARVVRLIQARLRAHPEVEVAWLYGSRAKGNFKVGSDIDLAIDGDRLDDHLLATIHQELDDLPIPYTVDLSRLGGIGNPKLLAHIQRVGRCLYRKG